MSQVTPKTHCRCGAVEIELEFDQAASDFQLEQLQLRQCDCDFCTQRQVAWLSPPQATIKIKKSSDLKLEQQGSNQARFLSCINCGDMIVVTIQSDDVLRGAVNGNLFAGLRKKLEKVTVSPKKLSASEKLARWLMVWSRVEISGS